jgi:hypothetical protein
LDMFDVSVKVVWNPTNLLAGEGSGKSLRINDWSRFYNDLRSVGLHSHAAGENRQCSVAKVQSLKLISFRRQARARSYRKA